MIPPRGFKNELYPLHHRVEYSFGLSTKTSTMNSCMATLIRHTSDVIAGTPASIVVNQHHASQVWDAGAAVQKMSIIDKMKLSIKFNLTEQGAEIDKLGHVHFVWRPIHFSFPEKLDAADDDTGTTVASILELTKDATFEDVVPVSATKLPVVTATSFKAQPISSVNIIEDFGDYNMTTDLDMEACAWDETLFQDAVVRYTNKGALKACVGRTRHVHLTKNKPSARFFFDKFVPKSIRRVMPYSFMAILVHVPLYTDFGQDYQEPASTGNLTHVGCKILAHYDEWNADHYQDMTGTPP